MTATPSGTTVRSGNTATYTVSVSPMNGFNSPVLLSCPPAFPGIPIGSDLNDGNTLRDHGEIRKYCHLHRIGFTHEWIQLAGALKLPPGVSRYSHRISVLLESAVSGANGCCGKHGHQHAHDFHDRA